MKRKKGFTLIELLVVISIIALLVSILMPALNKAREQATGVVCLSNVKNLVTAWMMYASEHDDMIPRGGPWTGSPSHTKFHWILPPMEDPVGNNNPSDYEVIDIGSNPLIRDIVITLKDRQRGIESGALWPYIENYEVYNCPGDKRWRTEDTPVDNYVTYSVSGIMRGEPWPTWGYKTPYTKLSQIRRPSSVWNFIEEITLDAGYNWGSCGPVLTGSDIGDIEWNAEAYGTWHNNSCAFGFCDGHAEMHKWQDPRTIAYFNSYMSGNPGNPDQPDNPDLLWMQQIYGGQPFTDDITDFLDNTGEIG